MKRITLFILLITSAIAGFSQEPLQECATVATPEQIAYMRGFDYSANPDQRRGIIYVPVMLHSIRNTNGSGGLTAANLDSILQNLNRYYINANIVFKLCGSFNFIDDSFFYDFDYDNESLLTTDYDIANVLNIYFANSVAVGGTPVCGYAYFPPSGDHIFISNLCALNKSTVPHEVGHYFSLYHTHGATNFGGTDELVDGSNCVIAGDEICDTPADPNLNGKVDAACNYTGTELDPTGLPYNPQTNNIMSYSYKTCRNLLTAGQFGRVNYSALNQRDYLTCGSCAVSLSANKTSFCTGDSAVLTASASSSGASYQWKRDGINIAGAASGTYIAKNPGYYSVAASDTNSCNASSNLVLLTENPVPAKPSVSVSGATLTSSAGSGNQWILNGSDISGATGSTYTVLANGYYKVRVTSSGCSNVSDSVFIVLAGVREALEARVRIFPNPAKDRIYMKSDLVNSEVKITDVRGMLVHQSRISDPGLREIDVSRFGKGIYFIHIISSQGSIARKMVIN